MIQWVCKKLYFFIEDSTIANYTVAWVVGWTEKDGIMRTMKEEVITVAARREWASESVPGRLGWMGCRSLGLGWGPAFVWGKAGDSGVGVGGWGDGEAWPGAGRRSYSSSSLGIGQNNEKWDCLENLFWIHLFFSWGVAIQIFYNSLWNQMV